MSLKYDLSDPNITQKIAELPEKMLEWAFEVLMKQAQLIRDLAKVYVLVDTGALRDSIRIERGGIGKHWRQVKIRAGGYVTNPKTGKRVNYALWVEMHSPFMLPALREVEPTIAEMIKAAVVEQAQ